MEEASDRGLLGIVEVVFMLGFTYEEKFVIIALCTGSNYSLVDPIQIMGYGFLQESTSTRMDPVKDGDEADCIVKN
ncbi:hypothetical protein ACFFQF_31590 [Haladaptatus pallidirubidus]|uniref:Uncharacterized protein n=1 Tax=Haladaptatus pallidirubidus TaxID=1008152 RepID=A0AAV3UQG3_9EURY|nr:hypothetical protein [Haladaptatus pallidirubidus]